MRLTHLPALRGLAVVGAGATLFGSAMLAGAQAANAAAPSTQAQPHVAVAMADSVMPDQGIVLTDQQVLLDQDTNGDQADGNDDSTMDQDRYGYGEHGKKHGKKHHKKHHGKADAEKSWGQDGDGSDGDSSYGDDPGRHHHHKCGHHGKKEAEADGGDLQGSPMDEKGGRHHHKRCHHHRRPWGHVESGEGGMAVASSSEQSPATSISLGLASAALFGSGVWMVRRTRRFGAVK